LRRNTRTSRATWRRSRATDSRVPWTTGNGGAALWLDCVIYREVAAGDHNIVLFYVHEVTPYPDVRPIVFHGSQFRQLLPSRVCNG